MVLFRPLSFTFYKCKGTAITTFWIRDCHRERRRRGPGPSLLVIEIRYTYTTTGAAPSLLSPFRDERVQQERHTSPSSLSATLEDTLPGHPKITVSLFFMIRYTSVYLGNPWTWEDSVKISRHSNSRIKNVLVEKFESTEVR